MEQLNATLAALLEGISLPLEQSEILQLLKEAHAVCGGLSPEIQQQLSQALHVSPGVISALIKVSPALRVSPAAHKITVCLGPCCRKRGSYALLKAVQNTLHIETGEQTADGAFRLETQTCLKRCADAPGLMIDDRFFSGLCPAEIPALLKRFYIV